MSTLHRVIEYCRDLLDRHGLAFGVPTTVGAVAVDAHAVGLHWLQALALLVGILSTGGQFTLKLLQYLDKKKAECRAVGDPSRRT